MSQPNEMIDLTGVDLESFTQAQYNQLFNPAGTGPAVNPYMKSEMSNDFDFNFSNSHPVPTDSSALPSVPTPDLSSYSSGQPSSGYSTLVPSTPQPYPIEQQQYHNPILAVDLPYRQRTQVLRSQTNTSYLQPSQSQPAYTRRRSLSQGDVGHVAAINAFNAQEPQATFIRMQAPRSRSAVPDANPHKRRAGHRQSRSTSRGPNARRDQAQVDTKTSVPDYINGLVPTRLGDPISPDSPRYHRPAAQQQWPIQNNTGRPAGNEVIIRHITRREDMEQSRRIIEIGAMAVSGQPGQQEHSNIVLKKLEDVECYLNTKGVDCHEALKGCATIREAIARNTSPIALPSGT